MIAANRATTFAATGPAARPVLRPVLLPVLLPAERVLLAMVFAIGAAALALVAAMGRVVEWGGFLPGLLGAVAIIAVGVYARAWRRMKRLGDVAVGIGLFMGFTAIVALFIYALFPLPRPMIDHELLGLDAMLGYDWVAFVEALARWPAIGSFLGWLYMSSLAQIILVIALLGAMGRETALHRFLMVGMLTMILAVAIWWTWPSVGPSAWRLPDPAAAERIGLVFSPRYGAILLHLVQEGPAVIRVEEIMGMVAFPSYHIVMAWMVLWYAWRTPLSLPFLASGIAMVPATLSHGGHHLVDLIAGSLLFGLCAWLAARIVTERIVTERGPAP
ncbi:phosphatase PAP2 family protein [Pseudogemmobacter sonorensis]|uniref:phosphatase PAP2 family protein n=1 Tax=Pseudogemmobacter sonorensis TaxID=2989681 RepID=UPI0036CBBF71